MCNLSQTEGAANWQFSVEALRLNESERPYSIVMIDMNNLKDINDTYGHEKGDISIITLARLICWTFRHSSIYRVGGDEFHRCP